MLYRDFFPRELAPGWLQTSKNAAWLRASGDLKDSLADRAKAAVKARFARLAPRDALDLLGSERQLERGPSESDATFAEHVAGAWKLWQWAGTAKGVLVALRESGYPNALIEIVNGNEFRLDASGEAVIEHLPPGSWAVEATPGFWSKFIVLLPSNPWGARLAADAHRASYAMARSRAWAMRSASKARPAKRTLRVASPHAGVTRLWARTRRRSAGVMRPMVSSAASTPR